MNRAPIQCRPRCGACCTALAIASPIPGLPQGKPAGIACPHLAPDFRCRLFGQPERPQVCIDFQPDEQVCGSSREQAMR